MITKSTVVLMCVLSAMVIVSPASAAPHISRATSVKGAIAYQDDVDNTQFWYVPTVAPIDNVGSSSLKTFSVTYNGIGPRYYACETGGICYPSYGANIGATINVDATPKTLTELRKEITKRYGVANPKLAPVRLSNVTVNSLLVDTLSVSDIKQKFSTTFQFKTDVGFTAGSNSSTFGANLASSAVGTTGIVPNPLFQIEFVGDAEFAGDPWIVEASCNLTQAWSYIRSSVSASASLGWFTLGQAQYESISEDLKRAGICSYKEIQGTLDVKSDILPVLEMTKKLFEEMNAQAATGEGFFKFEPNPEPAEVSAKGATSSWPWSVSVNVGYSSAAFTQSLTKTVRTEIQPKFKAKIGTTAVLAVKCTQQTKQHFADLGDLTEACITQRKTQQFAAISAQIYSDLQTRLRELSRLLELKQIDLATYTQLRQDAKADAGGALKFGAKRDGRSVPDLFEVPKK